MLINGQDKLKVKQVCRQHLLDMFESRIDVMINAVAKAEGSNIKHSFNIEIENVEDILFNVTASSPDFKNLLLPKDCTDDEKIQINQESFDFSDGDDENE